MAEKIHYMLPRKNKEAPKACTHGCRRPASATVFVRMHAAKPLWEVRRCLTCNRLSSYDTRIAR